MSDQSYEALAEIYEQNRHRLVRFLAARLGSQEEAEDAVQEVFLKLRNIESASRIENSGAYLFRIANNVAIDHIRHREATRKRDANWAETQGERTGTQLASDLPSPEAAYDAKARLEKLVAALENLSPKVRRVFVLHKFEGLTHKQVAAQLGISRSTVEKHMITALKALIHLRSDE